MRRGFTIVELLVVIVVIALLAALTVPLVQRTLERAKVAKVLVDLKSVEVALESYFADHQAYPPPTISCQGMDQHEILQLPMELAAGDYLPRQGNSKTSSLLEDPFHPGSTYKYIAPEKYWMNGQLFPLPYAVWVPDDFPRGESASGRSLSGAESPMAWAAWSVGPRAENIGGFPSAQVPLSSSVWYEKTGGTGIIARIRERHGAAHTTFPR